MQKFFTPVKLFALTGVLAASSVVYTIGFAQATGDKDKDKTKRKIEKRIEVEDHNGEKKVTVTTIENGNKKIETYTGEEAETYLKNQEGGNAGSGNFHMRFDFDFDSLMNKNSFDFKMDGFGEEFEKEMEKLKEELKRSGSQLQFDLDQLFKSLDTSFSNMGNNFKMYSFKFGDDDFKDPDSLLNGAFKFDMQFDNDEDNEDGSTTSPHQKRIIIAHSVIIEDVGKKKNAEKDLHISDLSFYPNPNGGNFTLRYKSESMDVIDISVMDMAGKTVYNERISATGTILRQVELNEPSGVYILNLKQGNKQVSKKLVIE